MNRQERFYNTAANITSTYGINNEQNFILILTARTCYRKHTAITITTAATYEAAKALTKALINQYRNILTAEDFNITFVSVSTLGVSGQVSNRAYDPSRRY